MTAVLSFNLLGDAWRDWLDPRTRSLMAAQAFRASGFEAYSLQGGLVRWAQEGRPLVPESGYVAEH